MSTEPFWSVVETEPRRERVASGWLDRGGFETYLPLMTTTTKRTIPLFPNYIFVRVAGAWYQIGWTIGVVRLLRNGDEPARLSDKIIAEIRHREGDDGLIRLPKRWKQGQQVRIKRGLFRDRTGIYDGMTSKQRERVLLNMLGRAVAVEFDDNDLEEVQHLAR
jgi:transcriptional antiterminator RfaH